MSDLLQVSFLVFSSVSCQPITNESVKIASCFFLFFLSVIVVKLLEVILKLQLTVNAEQSTKKVILRHSETKIEDMPVNMPHSLTTKDGNSFFHMKKHFCILSKCEN